jgi:Secretion system C-terminal sorting domain/SprB repeat
MRYQKLLLLTALLLFYSVAMRAQEGASAVQKARVFPSVRPTVVYARPVPATISQKRNNQLEEREDLVRHDRPLTPFEPQNTVDPVLQKETATPGKSINTITVINQFDGFGLTGVTPADPSGDAGIDRFVTSTNGSSASGGTRFAVYDKAGNVISASVSFNTLGTQTGGSGDPVILFDNQSNRWFISEMVSGAFRIYVSQTSNPIGAYFQYIVPSSGTGIPDYPKYGIWNDKIVITTNQTSPNNNVYVLNRVNMVAGTAVTPIGFRTDRPAGYALQNTGPADVDGPLNPDANSKAIILRHRDDEINGGTPDNTKDFIEYWELDIDFANPAASTMSSSAIRIDIAEFDTQLCGLAFAGCFAQPGTTTTLMPIREMMMYRVQYRRFPTHESIVLNFVTDVGSDRGGIRWCELRKTTGSWLLYQEGTFAPADGLNRWMGSIAQDKHGNIALGYAVGSSTKFPSLRITGRKASDPLGQMTEPETEVATGTNSSTSNRWGDYFHMAVDPVTDENFWFNGMYSTGGVLWRTRVAHFKFNNCLNPFNSTASATQNNTCFSASTGIITATPNGGTGPYTYQLDGGAPQSSNTFNNLAAGTYTVTVNDAAGCSSIATATVTQPAQIGISENVQNVLCNAGNTGTITVGVTNGVSPFSYKIGTGTPQTSNVFNNLAAGTYNVIVTDANGCSNQKNIVITQPAAITSSETKTDVLCNGGNNGSLTINATGGTGTLQYRIGSGALQTSNTFNNLTAGTYNITIADANNCTVTKSVTITQPAAVTAAPAAEQTKCFGEQSGKITVNGSGGTAPYQYKIGTSALQSSNVFNNLAAGTYNVFVRDANGCETSQSVTVTQPAQITGIITSVNPDASNRFSGTLKVDGANGIAPYQYSLNGGAFQTSGDFSSAYIIGQNTVAVKDANGCFVTLTKQIDLSVTDDTWKTFTKLYPNPNNGEFFVDIRGIRADQTFQIQIFDVAGRVVYSAETTSTNTGAFRKQLVISTLAAGINTMKITSKKNKGELNVKFVVTRK